MTDKTAGLIQYAFTLAALLTAALVLAIVHETHGSAVALGAMVGIATGSYPGSGIPRPIVGAGALALAIGAGSMLGGCTGAQAIAGGELTCEVVRKICQVAGSACAVVDPSIATTDGGR